MLHDPSHYEAPPIAEAIRLTSHDTQVLRRLAADVAEIAASPIHRETRSALAAPQRPAVRAADGLDQRNSLA